jgi:hypothetical protein
MFSRNVGPVDRILRIIIGAALIAGFFLMPEASYRWLFLIGIVPLATGLMSSCLIYRLFGISTNKT